MPAGRTQHGWQMTQTFPEMKSRSNPTFFRIKILSAVKLVSLRAIFLSNLLALRTHGLNLANFSGCGLFGE